MAPGSQGTLQAFSNLSKISVAPGSVAEEVANHVPRIPFDLDMDTFGKNLRSARKGAVGQDVGISVTPRTAFAPRTRC